MSTTATHDKVTLGQAREITTPAATMRTYAAPTGPVPASVAVWRVDMPAGAAGPAHVVSEDQVVVLVTGVLDVNIGAAQHSLGPGDSIVLPAGVGRRITAGPGGASGIVASLPGATAQVGDADPVRIPWAS